MAVARARFLEIMDRVQASPGFLGESEPSQCDSPPEREGYTVTESNEIGIAVSCT